MVHLQQQSSSSSCTKTATTVSDKMVYTHHLRSEITNLVTFLKDWKVKFNLCFSPTVVTVLFGGGHRPMLINQQSLGKNIFTFVPLSTKQPFVGLHITSMDPRHRDIVMLQLSYSHIYTFRSAYKIYFKKAKRHTSLPYHNNTQCYYKSVYSEVRWPQQIRHTTQCHLQSFSYAPRSFHFAL